jgi:hypothetical protein
MHWFLSDDASCQLSLSAANTSTTDSTRVTTLFDPPDRRMIDSSGSHQDITVHGLGGFGLRSGVTITPGEIRDSRI